MPPFKIVYNITTRPFAADDLHLLCMTLGIFRAMQLCCIVPLWIFMYVRRIRSHGDLPTWCIKEDSNDPAPSTEDANSPWMTLYLFSSLAHCIADISLLAAIWSAASLGTPTVPMRRDVYLRPLLRIKLFWMNLWLLGLVAFGVMMVQRGRQNNYGCGEEAQLGFETTGWYATFCVILVTQALDVCVVPAVLVNKATQWIRKQSPLQISTTAQGRNYDRCIVGCFKCCGLLCCKKIDLHQNKGQMRDAADATLEFFGDGVELTLSDLNVSFRMLARVQRERRFKSIAEQQLNQQQRIKSNVIEEEMTPPHPHTKLIPKATSLMVGVYSKEDDDDGDDDEDALKYTEIKSTGLLTMVKRQSMTMLKRDDNMDASHSYFVTIRDVLGGDDVNDDTALMQDAIRYANHSSVRKISSLSHLRFVMVLSESSTSFLLVSLSLSFLGARLTHLSRRFMGICTMSPKDISKHPSMSLMVWIICSRTESIWTALGLLTLNWFTRISSMGLTRRRIIFPLMKNIEWSLSASVGLLPWKMLSLICN